MSIKAIETRYAGCRFRSRLEARWAVFFDHMGISWQYEPQGFTVGDRSYLPDFLLDECGTWVEVKGSEDQLDTDLMMAAAEQLPTVVPRSLPGPTLMLLGPVPQAPISGDLFWLCLDQGAARVPWPTAEEGVPDWLYPDGLASRPVFRRCGFGDYANDRRPNALVDFESWLVEPLCGEWLWAVRDLDAYNGAADAYEAARSARFEHGETS